MLNKKVKSIELDISNKRVFCLSDIHGEYKVLDNLLQKNNFDKTNDLLFILGDLTRKGTYPLKTLRYLMDIKNENIYILMGNCDEADIFDVMLDDFEKFMYAVNTKTIVRDLLKEIYHDIPEITQTNFKEYQNVLLNTKEMNFLKELPHVIITEKYIFSHAKMPNIIDLNNDTYIDYIRGRNFYDKGHSNPQIAIVGHMPSTIFSKNCYNNQIHYEDNMIFVDGGMCIYHSGQINLLIIENNKIVKEDSSDNLEERVCLTSQLGQPYAKGTC